MARKELRRMVDRERSIQQKESNSDLFKHKLFHGESARYLSSNDEWIIQYVLNTKNNICFRDHIVNGKPCLPSDAYLDLIYVACQSYLNFDKVVMNKVVMTKPIIANIGESVALRLHFVRDNENYNFKLISYDHTSKRERVHIRGVVSNYIANNLKNSDLFLNEELVIENFDVTHFYNEESNIHLGDFYHALHSLKFYHNYAVGEISISKPDDSFSINPSVVSAALGSAITFSSHCNGGDFSADQHVFLPYSIDGLKLYGSFSGKSYSCIIKLIKNTKSSVECCLQIINEDGKLIFEIINFRLRKISVKKVIDDKEEASQNLTHEEVAIIGVACRFPKSDNIVDFWKLLKNSQDCIEEVPKNRWREFDGWYHPSQEHAGTASSKYGGFIESYDRFDPLFFNISPAEAVLMDPQQRIFLEEAWGAIENAGYAPGSLSNVTCGVYVGCAEGDYTHALSKANKSWEAQSFPGTSGAVLAARMSYLLNLKGPSMAIDTSCSSSLTAIHLAAQSIRFGENELAIAGGINIFSTPLKQVFTSQIGMQSKDGRCHSFDQSANGTVFSEGCGVVLLKPLARAIQDGDNIWGIIKASGINQDGKTNGITAPSALSQTTLLNEVYQKYKINPDKISYIETHGTGTVLGDPIEIQGLKGAFEKFTDKKNFCAIGSIKSNIGHAVYASGVAGLIKVLLCLRHKQLVPSINYNNTNKHIDFDDSPFFVNKENKHWQISPNINRMAAVSSFGFSGSNAHIVVEEYAANSQKTSLDSKLFVIPISAKSVAALNRNVSNLYFFLNDTESFCAKPNLENIVYTLQVGRDVMNYRAAFIASTVPELIEKLALFLNDKGNISLNDGKDPNRTEVVQQDKIESWLVQGDWVKLVNYWISGNKVPWEILYRDLKPNKVVLPGYSFEDERYWPKLTNSSAVKEESNKLISTKKTSSAHKQILHEKIEYDLMNFIHQLLHVPLDRLDVNTNLTEFGFDSVNFVQYARTISNYFNVAMTPAKLFYNSTVAAIARSLQTEHCDEISKFYDANTFSINEINKDVQDETITVDHIHLNEVKRDKNLKVECDPIAIVGISGKFPKSDDLDMYWQNLLEGKDCISEIPLERWDWKDYYSQSPENENKTDIIWGGFIDDVQKFDPDFFGLSDEEAETLDPQQRLLLKYAYKAIEDAGYNPTAFSDGSAGVFMGIGNNGYDGIVESSKKLLDGYFITGALPSVGPNRISYFFDFHGPSEPVETACASSLVAIDRAVNAINNNVCEVAIVGGVNVIVSPNGHIALNKAGLLSKEGRCKPFSSNADGFVRSEGVGVLVLKRLSLAERDNDQIYAVIRGSGVNHNGKGNFLTAPNPMAQSDLLESVYRRAGVDINTLTYIEAHGTGTELGDGIEIEGLKLAFKKLGYQQKHVPSCAVGSIKSNIGHTEVASGIASIIKVLYQIKTKTLVKTIHCDTINPDLQLDDSPFYIVRANQKWGTVDDEAGVPLPYRAGVSAFGLGGVNAHVILEEYVDKRVKQERQDSEELIVLSAKDQVQLESTVQSLHDFLIKNKEIALTDVAYTLQQGRQARKTRLAIVASSIEDLLNTLENYLRHIEDTNSTVKYFDSISEKNTETKLLFQGDAGEYFLQQLMKSNDLARLALYWAIGGEIDWDLMRKNNIVRRVSLPGYQFCEDNYWIAKKGSQLDIKKHDISSYIYKMNLNKFNNNKLFLRWYEDA